jgi:hypothetical protein
MPWSSLHGPQSAQYLSDPGFVLQVSAPLPEELLLLVDDEELEELLLLVDDEELEELLTPPPKIVGST